jgi:hypothetical protein
LLILLTCRKNQDCLVPLLLQNSEAGGNSAPHLMQEVRAFTNRLNVACLGPCAVLGFNMTYTVKRTRIPITIAASGVKEPSVNLRGADSGTMLVELSVLELEV